MGGAGGRGTLLECPGCSPRRKDLLRQVSEAGWEPLFTCPVVHPGEEQVLGEGGGLGESPESGVVVCAIMSPGSGCILSLGLGVLVCEVGSYRS